MTADGRLSRVGRAVQGRDGGGRKGAGAALAAGSAISGLLAYVFFATATRALGPDGAAPMSVLWTWWAFASAALTFPIQHWVARTAAAHGEPAVRAALPRVALVAAALAAASALASWWLRADLFRLDGWQFPALAGAVTASAALLGLVRGVLSARRRFGALAVNLVGENAVRCLVAVGLALAGHDSPVGYGLALLAGYGVCLTRPSALRLGRAPDNEGDGSPRAGSATAFLAGAGAGQLLGQAVLTGGAVVLALAGGTAAQVTSLFAALALFRAPYTLGVGMVAPLTGWFTTLVVARDTARLHRVLTGLIAVALAGAGAAAAIGWWLGGPLVAGLFGPGVRLADHQNALVAVGSSFAIATLIATIVALAHGRPAALVRAWLIALVPGIGVFALGGWRPLDATCAAFAVVEAVAFVVLAAEIRRANTTLAR